MAIFYALESPELEVVGLTTVFGNADTVVTTRNALSLLEIAERSDIPVAAGAVKPLAMDYRGAAAFVHGLDGQGGVELPAPATAPLATDAAHFIIDTVMSSPGSDHTGPARPPHQRRPGDAPRAEAHAAGRRDRADGGRRVRRWERIPSG